MKTFYIATMVYGSELVAFTVAPECKLRQDERTIDEMVASAKAKGHIVTPIGPDETAPPEAARIVRALEAAGIFKWGLASALGTRYYLCYQIEVPSGKK